jgi:hypothetical protein
VCSSDLEKQTTSHTLSLHPDRAALPPPLSRGIDDRSCESWLLRDLGSTGESHLPDQPIPFGVKSLIELFRSRLGLADRHFVIESGGMTKYEAALTAELVNDGEYLAPGKLRQPVKQGIECARPLLHQLRSNGRLDGRRSHHGMLLVCWASETSADSE